MFSYEICDTGFVFRVVIEDCIVPPSLWLENGFAIYNEILQELVDNGFGEIVGNEYVVPYMSIYEIDLIEREMLGLPLMYPFDLYVEAKGMMTRPDFKYEYSFRSFAPNGDCFKVDKINGPIIEIEGQPYLLSKEQYKLISSINEFNNLPVESKTTDGNLIKFTTIKDLSSSSAICLDSYLNDKDVILPKHIKIKIDYRDNKLDIIPTIEHEVGDKFSQYFDKLNAVRSEYPISLGGGKKVHVVIDDKQYEALNKIKKEYRCVSSPDVIKKIIETPETIFDTDVIDISEFYSERVVEIGLYKPCVSKFLSPYKSQWIPSFKIEDKTNGTTNISFKNYKELAAFRDKINIAEETKSNVVVYNGAQIPIQEAIAMEIAAKTQLDKKEVVTKTGENSIKERQKQTKVLLIEENLEELGYQAGTTKREQISSYKLFPNNFLDSSVKLKEHQEVGIAWLQNMLQEKSEGCLLADDMGLGKTLQLLYLIDWHYRNLNKECKPYLIVAPVALLENWENEYNRFFKNPKLPIMRISSAPKELNQKFINEISNLAIILVSYETMRISQFNFCAVDFAICVLDEAQKIKTPGTLVTNAAKALKSDFKVAMTGTPIENSFVDLWCIMDFAVPGLLGNAKDFSTQYHFPLKRSDVDICKIGEEIRNKVDTYFMRRLKTDIAHDLPSKQILYHKQKMPSVQLARYTSIINSSFDEPHCLNLVLMRIMRIRALCDHPLLEDNYSLYDTEYIINSSAKLIATFEILENIKLKEEKVIIFTDRKEMQRILQHTIYYKMGISPRIINGETSATPSSRGGKLSRQQTIDAFQRKEGFNVIIMSPLAAGMGLNVVGANHVIHYSRHWNPAKEMQATDRVYRIGQTKDVYVHYPMAIADDFDTFDIVLDKLLSVKTKLADSTLFPTEMVEIERQVLYDNLFSAVQTSKQLPLDHSNIDSMNDYMFEAYAAALFKKQGYEVYLTPRVGDKGIDVIAFSNKVNYAIQCKHSGNNIGRECIGEVVTGTKYYEIKHNCIFKPLVFTNSYYTNQAIEMGQINGVELYDRDTIKSLFSNIVVNWSDIYQMEENRMS